MASLIDLAARDYGVPNSVLEDVCTHESQTFHNGQRQAWPWVLNIRGTGYWYESKTMMLRGIQAAQRLGIRNIDIGVCQVNWHWHGEHFSSPTELAEPLTNIRYAAKVLASYKKIEDEGWAIAIGRYHAPYDSQRATTYSQVVLRHRANSM